MPRNQLLSCHEFKFGGVHEDAKDRRQYRSPVTHGKRVRCRSTPHLSRLVSAHHISTVPSKSQRGVTEMSKITTLNACPGGGCHAGCIHLTHVKDGKIVKIERVIYPDGEKGTICEKGVAGARLPYHPDRLKYPLKRAGRRGDGKWEQVTWERVLDEIADKIKMIREKYKPESVAMLPVFNSTQPYVGIQPMLGFRLMHLLQATHFGVGIPIDSNPFFASYFSFGDGTMGSPPADPRTLLEGKTKYMINWGANPAEMSIRFMKFISEAQRRGAKLVDIGLLFDPTAEKASWWIPVKAGSDNALALAMISVIFNDKLYDEEYLMRYTNGPFLVPGCIN